MNTDTELQRNQNATAATTGKAECGHGHQRPGCRQGLSALHYQRSGLLTYTAYPVEPAHRGNRGRILALPPTPGAMWINNVGLIRNALRDKGSNYSELDKPLEDPLIVAINTWWVPSTSMRTRNLTHFRIARGRLLAGHPATLQ